MQNVQQKRFCDALLCFNFVIILICDKNYKFLIWHQNDLLYIFHGYTRISYLIIIKANFQFHLYEHLISKAKLDLFSKY